jgi:hypothetical protein
MNWHIRMIHLTRDCMLCLSLFMSSAMACWCQDPPPGDPDCCWCADGVWVCECLTRGNCGRYGWKCEDRCCLICWDWDEDTPISGSITVPAECVLCQQTSFFSDIEDVDHWIDGYGWQGWPPDSLSYSWSTNPAVGVWDGTFGTNHSTAWWTAPACIQTITVRLDVDDWPDTAHLACSASEDRDDPNVVFTSALDVLLPPDCEEGQASIDVLLQEIPPVAECNPQDHCGYTAPVSGPPISNSFDAVYDNCTWVFQVYAIFEVESGICPQITDISTGDDSDLTEDNYCAIVGAMMTGSGCTCYGAGTYTSHECAGIHEAYHLEYWRAQIDVEEGLMLASLPNTQIDCADSSTTTCQQAESEHMYALAEDVNELVAGAYFNMHNNSEAGAVAAASSCFYDLAAAICSHAQSQNWQQCTPSVCP